MSRVREEHSKPEALIFFNLTHNQLHRQREARNATDEFPRGLTVS